MTQGAALQYNCALMQNARLPELLFPLRFAETRRTVEGEVQLSGMTRLRDSVLSLEGVARVSVTGDIDPEKRPFLNGRVQASLQVTCQRCMQPMTVAVDSEFLLSPVHNEEEAEELPEAYDPVMLNEEEGISVMALVEDELMLSLPVVALHEPEDCTADVSVYEGSAEPVKADKPNPFAVLEQLKSDLKH